MAFFPGTRNSFAAFERRAGKRPRGVIGKFNANWVRRKFVAVQDFVMYTLSIWVESGLDMATRFFEHNATTIVGKSIGIKIGSYDGFKPERRKRILDTNPATMDKYAEFVTGDWALQELLEGL